MLAWWTGSATPLSGSPWALPLVLQSVPMLVRPSVTKSALPWELLSVPLLGALWALPLVLELAPMSVRPSVTPSGRLSVLQSE